MSDLDDIMEQQITRMKARQREKQIAAGREHRDRRERIATAAMAGLLGNTQWLPPDTTYPHIAEYAVRSADALIRELDKPKEDKT